MIKQRIAVGVLTIASVLAVAGPVAAKDGDLIARGRCSAASTWKLKLSPEGRRIEIEFEVDQNRNNRLWNVRAAHDGKGFWSGTRRTKAPSGSFSVRLLRSESAGSDRIAVRATNATTGEVCRGVLTSNF